MDGRDEVIRLRGEEIDRLNAELRALAQHADHLNTRIVALDDELSGTKSKLQTSTKEIEQWREHVRVKGDEHDDEVRKLRAERDGAQELLEAARIDKKQLSCRLDQVTRERDEIALASKVVYALADVTAERDSLLLRLDRGRMLAASWTDCPFTTMDQGTMKTCGEEMLRVLGEKWIAESNPQNLEMLREIEFFLRGHPGEASVLRAKVKALIDGAVERRETNCVATSRSELNGEPVRCTREVGHAGMHQGTTTGDLTKVEWR
jgi:hypothetical protein